jgi:hypothetical protein
MRTTRHLFASGSSSPANRSQSSRRASARATSGTIGTGAATAALGRPPARGVLAGFFGYGDGPGAGMRRLKETPGGTLPVDTGQGDNRLWEGGPLPEEPYAEWQDPGQ